MIIANKLKMQTCSREQKRQNGAEEVEMDRRKITEVVLEMVDVRCAG